MGRPRSTDSRTDPAILEYRRQYYYANKNKLLEAAKARYAAKAMAKEKKEKEQKPTEQTIKDDILFYETWLFQLKSKLPSAKGWLKTAIENQITTIEHQINAKGNTKDCNNQTDWETDI